MGPTAARHIATHTRTVTWVGASPVTAMPVTIDAGCPSSRVRARRVVRQAIVATPSVDGLGDPVHDVRSRSRCGGRRWHETWEIGHGASVRDLCLPHPTGPTE